MEIDVREFLKQFSFEELLDQRILVPQGKYYHLTWVKSDDVVISLPLIGLMREHNVTRLVAPERRWFLASDGEFANPRSKGDEVKEGRADELSSPRHVFRQQQKHINPYYYHQSTPDTPDNPHEPEPKPQPHDSSVITFGLERDLQRALRTNIIQLEPDLNIIDGGSERTVEAGRIDITAEDDQGNLVVIELKAGTAQPDSIAQLLSYMGSIDDDQERPIRGILVAHDFHPRLVLAARAVPNISLKAYSFQFSFEDR